MDHSTGTITTTNIGTTSIGAAPALTLAHSLAQHDHKLMIKTNMFVTIFVLFCFFVFCFCSLLWIFKQKSMPVWMIGTIIWKLRTTWKIFLEEEVEV